jgi:hypothetical protein
MKRIFLIGLFLGYCVIVMAGCACLKEGMRGFLGISTRDIENARDKAIVRVVDYDYSSCYRKVQARLVEIGSYIYAKRKDLIAVYISSSDTTPAGIFFKQLDEQKTELSITSPAADTREYLAEKILSALEKR